jgi:hypothetical protein
MTGPPSTLSSSFNVVLQAIPIDGRFILRPLKDKTATSGDR